MVTITTRRPFTFPQTNMSEDIKKELDTAYGQVSRIMERCLPARDSDRVLYFQVLRDTLTAKHLGAMNESVFLATLSNLIRDAYAPSTIKRVRAEIQNDEKRLEASEEVKKKRSGRQTAFSRWASERKEWAQQQQSGRPDVER